MAVQTQIVKSGTVSAQPVVAQVGQIHPPRKPVARETASCLEGVKEGGRYHAKTLTDRLKSLACRATSPKNGHRIAATNLPQAARNKDAPAKVDRKAANRELAEIQKIWGLRRDRANGCLHVGGPTGPMKAVVHSKELKKAIKRQQELEEFVRRVNG